MFTLRYILYTASGKKANSFTCTIKLGYNAFTTYSATASCNNNNNNFVIESNILQVQKGWSRLVLSKLRKEKSKN